MSSHLDSEIVAGFRGGNEPSIEHGYIIRFTLYRQGIIEVFENADRDFTIRRVVCREN